MAELTVSWEEMTEVAFEWKKEKYSKFACCTEAGWKASTSPMEVSCRGFVGKSTQQLLKTFGVTGFKQNNPFRKQTKGASGCGSEEETLREETKNPRASCKEHLGDIPTAVPSPRCYGIKGATHL